MQLHAVSKLEKYIGQKNLQVVPNSFILYDFNHCLLVGHFSTNKSVEKFKNIDWADWAMTLLQKTQILVRYFKSKWWRVMSMVRYDYEQSV